MQQAPGWTDALLQIFCAFSQRAELRAGSWGALGLMGAAAAPGRHQGVTSAPEEGDAVECSSSVQLGTFFNPRKVLNGQNNFHISFLCSY